MDLVDALGPERVQAVMLPYRLTSNESLSDAPPAPRRSACAMRHCRSPSRSKGSSDVARMFAGKPRDITEENLRAARAATSLMAISNKSGAMVVTTGNKSEMSVGYATLYGDINGGFNPIKDIYKMEVFRLSELRNCWSPAGAHGPTARSSRKTSSPKRQR